ncbi:histidine triad superfamily, third branch [Scheffersomyces xylosifermentans]|uniref:histidine triad superfamily, third branch n=1 Tax=Scheffersomyces xylosifermentans TaxID=1304137 RepID=UPI00315DC066
MSFQDVFQAYIDNPSKYKQLVEFEDENVLIIKDQFPKAIRHYLVIPRAPEVTHVHPLEVFNRNYKKYSGDELYDLISFYIEKAKTMIIEDLDKLFDHPKENKLALAELKVDFIRAGVHSVPSLRNLHFHVITQDFESERLKNKKHYNSFTTPFFVDFDKLDPWSNKAYDKLNRGGFGSENQYDSDSAYSSESEDDRVFIRHERDKTILDKIIKTTPLKCTYCGAVFGNKFQELKQHLKEEYLKKYALFDGFEPAKLTPNQFK